MSLSGFQIPLFFTHRLCRSCCNLSIPHCSTETTRTKTINSYENSMEMGVSDFSPNQITKARKQGMLLSYKKDFPPMVLLLELQKTHTVS